MCTVCCVEGLLAIAIVELLGGCRKEEEDEDEDGGR